PSCAWASPHSAHGRDSFRQRRQLKTCRVKTLSCPRKGRRAPGAWPSVTTVLRQRPQMRDDLHGQMQVQSQNKRRPAGISANGPLIVSERDQALRSVTAAAFLVELLNYAAFVGSRRSNCTRNERKGDKRGKDGFHDLSPKG